MSLDTPAPDPVALQVVTANLLARRREILHQMGVELRQHLYPVTVMGNSEQIADLIDAALAWTITPGTRLLVRVELKNWPEHGLIQLRSSQAVHVAGETLSPSVDGPAWERLMRAAQAQDVAVKRESGDGYIQLTLEFVHTVKHESALTALDVDRQISPDTWRMASGGSPIAGAQVLLVTDDERLDAAVKDVCKRLDLQLESVTTSRQAARRCELSAPDLIIIDAHQNDAEFQQLHADLLREEIHFPVVEVTKETLIQEIPSWEGSISRIGRDGIRRRLPSALAMALASGK
jgi:CheY-like chemotaxis protein